MSRRRRPAPARRQQVQVSRALAWEAKVAAMRDGRVERSNVVSPDRRRADRRKRARGRSCRDW